MDLYLTETPAIIVEVVVATIAVLFGLFILAKKFLHPFSVDSGANDAISGALGAIGVFYGVTVGLVAVDVWQRHSGAQDIAAREAAAIQTLHLIISHTDSIGRRSSQQPPEAPPLDEVVPAYLLAVICDAWDKQRNMKRPDREWADWKALRTIRKEVLLYEPQTSGQKVRYAAAFQEVNRLSELRRLRVDAANDHLSWVMWMVILSGAVLTMGLVYVFKLEDNRLHVWLVGLLSSFLGLVFLVIVLNDRPFVGPTGIEPESYVQVAWIMKPNPFSVDRPWQEGCPPRKPAAR